MPTALSNISIGSIVKIKESGIFKDYIVVKHGYPTSGNGRTLLMRKYLITPSRQWNYTSFNNEYSGSYADSFTTFNNTLDAYVFSNIIAVSIPYSTGGTTHTLTTLSRKTFIPSGTEMGFAISYLNVEGSAFSIFTTSESKKAMLETTPLTPQNWWLRSPATDGSVAVWLVTSSGTGSTRLISEGNYFYARPCFTLPSTITVNDDSTIAESTSFTMYIKKSGVWTSGIPYIKRSGVWNQVNSAYKKINGVWTKNV